MPSSQGGVLHHISKRKRGLARVVHGYPADKSWVRTFDKIMLIIAVINPLIALPQIFRIFSLQTAEGLSLLSWGGYALFNIPWLIYGFIHKEKPLIIAYILALLGNSAVVIGIIMYG